MNQSDTNRILEKVETLSKEEKVYIVDQILQSIHKIDVEIEKNWVKVAEERLTEIREGDVSLKSDADLFAEIDRKFKR